MKLTNFLRQAFVSAVMQDVPQEDFDEQIDKARVQAIALQLPPKVRAVWEDPLLRGYIDVFSICVLGDAYIQIPDPWGYDSREAKAVREAVTPLIVQRAAARKARTDLRNKLEAVVAGCSTRKQLVEALPEFEKYALQEPAKLAGLPAVSGVVADLVAAGWPKGGK